MLLGHADGLSEMRSSRDQLLPDPESELEDDDDEAASTSEQILYTASFEELARNIIQRYVLQKDISSRKLYVTQSHVVYKISRPSFIPFWGVITIEKQVPLSMVIDIIIEQGWLQSLYGIHTFRIESIARGKAAPVDELQVQGVANPGLLRKVIITEASKVMQDIGISRKPATLAEEGETFSQIGSPTERPLIFKSPSKSLKMTGSPRFSPMDRRGIIPEDLVLNKLEEVSRSVKKIESLMEKSQSSPKSKAVKQLKFGH
ncbi:uncharacterized protein LOC119982038 isoform X3 [Tripterygium wilfordii]|uniref:uncharacterized protein LOC119982038 isoform X3 n=1 Tax=Tripterygium wilfordii TaxID=458696 RepID=UPI0018F860A2|nr:uncharacterized protein LOC119982038 isoform X3 [Tripterygium wilfordii]